MNSWFMLEDAGRYNKNVFSLITSTNDVKIKYDILEINFQINCKLYWFVQSRRRNEDVEMSLLYSYVSHNVSLEEIFSIPFFKKNTLDETDEIKKAEKIQKIIANNDEIKKALILKYAKCLASNVYGNNKNVTICEYNDRFGNYNDALNYREKNLLGEKEDDYTEITDIEKCIISVY